MEFIEIVATHVLNYHKNYGIKVVSPIIAQACLETGFGISEKAKVKIENNNIFGMKYKESRVRSYSHLFTDSGWEVEKGQNVGLDPNTLWYGFKSIEQCVVGYFEFIQSSWYYPLKECEEYERYCYKLQECGYATDPDYAQKLINIIAKYDLQKYDYMEIGGIKDMNKKIKIVLDAGHGMNTLGKRCLKSIDPRETREWYLNQRIANIVEDLLKDYEVEIIRVDDRTGATDVPLSDRCRIANNEKADIYISIHHNAGINGGTGGGSVVFCYDDEENIKSANRLYDYLVARTGLRGNRSVKVSEDSGFYVIRNTRMKAFLIENGFMDSRTDTPIILTDEHARRSAEGIANYLVYELGILHKPKTEEKPTEEEHKYTIVVGTFSNKENADALRQKLIKDGYGGFVKEI